MYIQVVYIVVQKAALVAVPFLCSTTWELCWNKQELSSSEQHMSCLFLRHEFLSEQLEAFPQLHRSTHVHYSVFLRTVRHLILPSKFPYRNVLIIIKTHFLIHRGKTQHLLFLQVFWLQKDKKVKNEAFWSVRQNRCCDAVMQSYKQYNNHISQHTNNNITCNQ